MELKSTTIKDIEKMQGKNVIIIISNGKMKVAELPSFGIVEITSHDEKVTFVEEKKKTRF